MLLFGAVLQIGKEVIVVDIFKSARDSLVRFFGFLPLVLPFHLLHDILCRVGGKWVLNLCDVRALEGGDDRK